MILKNYKTSFSKVKKNDEKILKKIKKYIINPNKILPRILWEYKKYILEINWKDRVRTMGNSSVYANHISREEQKKVTKIHEKLLFKVLKNRIKKKSKFLDFGCGYGRFQKFFEKKFKIDYLGVEKENFFLKKLNSKKFISYKKFTKIKKYNNYFDIIFMWAVLGGFNNKNVKQIIEILKKKLSKQGIFCCVEIVSKIEKQGYWRFRTIQYYKNLFKGFAVNSDFYFIEDGQKRNFFLFRKN